MQPEFSRPIAVDRIGLKDKTYRLEADRQECADLAKRLGIPDVNSLCAEISLRLSKDGKLIRLKGHIRAELVQICVVSLEQIATLVDEDFALTYGLESAELDGEVVIDLSEDDPPEPVVNGIIDMGEAAAEHLALAMDPFPRMAGVEFQPPEDRPENLADAPARANPFEILAEHRKK